MAGFNHIFKQDYDKRIKIGDEYVFCYSAKKLRELYPEKDYLLSGEARRASKKSLERFEASQAKKLQKLKEKGVLESEVSTLKVGDLHIGKSVLSVYPEGSNNKLLGKNEGYVCVADGNFVSLHASRVPFLAVIGSMAAAIIATVVLTVALLLNPESPLYINPDNPLPMLDPNVTPIEDDNSEKVVSKKGGGSITVQFRGSVNISISKETAALYYNNPNASNQDVVVELYIMNGQDEYFLGRSGRVPAGNSLEQISIKDREVELKEGHYTGKLYFHSYDPMSGAKAVVVANIGNIDFVVEK